ncbi:MAG TPA: hypothetical protein V6C76_11600 [Drouetiella sp.]
MRDRPLSQFEQDLKAMREKFDLRLTIVGDTTTYKNGDEEITVIERHVFDCIKKKPDV